jgi:hypothetical protein
MIRSITLGRPELDDLRAATCMAGIALSRSYSAFGVSASV